MSTLADIVVTIPSGRLEERHGHLPFQLPNLECINLIEDDPRASRPVEAVATVTGLRNIRMMHLLERIAARFNEAGVPVLALKGSALNLMLYGRADDRPMDDLDLLIKPEDVDRVFALLEGLGGLRGDPLVREDFFPRFHYEMEYRLGKIHPVSIDLHVRPFRPLRYSRLVSSAALWQHAVRVPIGRASILVACPEDMLVHLAAHAAIHGNPRSIWRRDIKLWADAHRTSMDWDHFVATVNRWRMSLPVRMGLEAAERDLGRVCPPEVMGRLERSRVSWRDRLALWQAPRDADHPKAHVAVNVLCTPSWSFVLGYLRAMLLPDRGHMADWYCRRHWGWLPCAHLLRWLGPLAKWTPRLWSCFSKIETLGSRIHGVGVFAIRDIKPGEVIARYHGKEVERCGMYVVPHKDRSGRTRRVELTGKLKFLNHSCRPRAELAGFELMALKPIQAGQEITISYGEGACDCKSIAVPEPTSAPQEGSADAA